MGGKKDPYRENAMRQLFVTNAFRKMLPTKSLSNVVCSPKACFMQPVAWGPSNKPHYSHRVQVQHERIHQAFITDMWLSAQRKKQFEYITFNLCLWLVPKEHPWSSSYSSCELLQWMVHLIPHVAWGQEGRSVDDLLLACLLLDDTPSKVTLSTKGILSSDAHSNSQCYCRWVLFSYQITLSCGVWTLFKLCRNQQARADV